jgi:hypothetical protein
MTWKEMSCLDWFMFQEKDGQANHHKAGAMDALATIILDAFLANILFM